MFSFLLWVPPSSSSFLIIFSNHLINPQPQDHIIFFVNNNGGVALNRIIGAALIVVGLYLVLWGKSEEKKFVALEKAAIQSTPEHGNIRTPTTHIKTSLTQPLLPSSTENV